MTDPAVAPGRRPGHRLAPRNWSLRAKLSVVLLVPGLLALTLAGLRIADQSTELAQRGRVERFVVAQGANAAVVGSLQQERYRATVFVAGGRSGDTGPLREISAAVDEARSAARPSLVALNGADPAVDRADVQAQLALDQLPRLRELVSSSSRPAASILDDYSTIIARLDGLSSTLLRGVNALEVTGLVRGLAGLTAVREEATLQLALVIAAQGADLPAALSALQASDVRVESELVGLRDSLDADQQVRFGTAAIDASNVGRGGLLEQILAGPDVPELRTTTASFYGGFVIELDIADAGLREELTVTIAARKQDTVDLATINAAVLLLTLLVGGTIVGLIATGMIASLSTLRVSALDVAARRLPEAVARMRGGTVPDIDVEEVPVDTLEEIGEVARAFDAVHRQAVRLAAEQATLQGNVNGMFINLSRRSQSLVDRQLQLIEQLESNEQNHEQLGNLFRLDHLATRMRRNCENLLVLAGTDLGNRASASVPVVDVLRAALSEMEQYERVTLLQPPPVEVAGWAASDLQHLLSELLDNATTFSAPGTPVRVSTDRAPGGGLVVTVTDEGIGMHAADLAAANEDLGRHNEVTVGAARRMGLFVVGRLASRHDIAVRLIPGPALGRARDPNRPSGPTGITAVVTVPVRVIVEVAPPPVVPRPRLPEPPPAHPSRSPVRTASVTVPPPALVGLAAALPGTAFPAVVLDPAGPTPTRPEDTDPPPIYDEVVTSWFRPHRSVPINWIPDPLTGARCPDPVPYPMSGTLPPMPGPDRAGGAAGW